MTAPSVDEVPILRSGWVLGALAIAGVLIVGAGLWFSHHP